MRRGSRGWLWIFDLDDTLHDASRHVFPALHRTMTGYIAERLGVHPEAADALRAEYWQRYGATLVGMIRHHDICPRDFLEHTHRFDDLAALLVAEPGLRQALGRLPGRRVVLTNAPQAYGDAVTGHLGIRRAFCRIHGIEHAGFRPKPHPAGLRRLLREARVPPRRCVLVEDSLETLRTARRMGLRTVWISRSMRRAPQVDLRLRSVRQLPRALHRLARPASA